MIAGEPTLDRPIDVKARPTHDPHFRWLKETVVAALRLNHVSLRVRDLAASANFYQDALQLPEIACGAGRPNIRWFGLGEGQSLHLIEGDFGKTFVTMSTH